MKRYDNLIVGRTMSKAFGLAGMRLGYAVAPEWIADQYRRAAPPFFGITCASVAAGVAALSDWRSCAVSGKDRGRAKASAKGDSIPSLAGQLPLSGDEQASDAIVERFQARGIIIRDCRSFRGAGEHHVRVTVGTPSENDRFLSAFREICE